MNTLHCGPALVTLPMPVLVVVEDVGWWRGEDGSHLGQPYRNRFPRSHCPDDYRALARLGRGLGMRVPVGMVLGEWDRDNILAEVPGATWQGQGWDNQGNVGPHLDQAAACLRDNGRWLELACHGLCHEFWQQGAMSRSEFHDEEGRLRDEAVVRRHLAAYDDLLRGNGLPSAPRLFLPPALNHGFGGRPSMQALLADFGYRFVVTRFARMRCQMPPQTPWCAWEHGVRLLERGLAPVPWHEVAAAPCWDFSGPVLPLHWGNLLHPEPQKNGAVVDAWVEMLLRATRGPERLLVPDLQACWDQCVVWSLGSLTDQGGKVVVDLRRAWEVPGFSGSFSLSVSAQKGSNPGQGPCRVIPLRCRGAEVAVDIVGAMAGSGGVGQSRADSPWRDKGKF